MLIPVVLSGGSGTRLWPLSRALKPKQFLKLTSSNTLFQETILRLNGKFEDPLIVCNEKHRFLVAEQCKQINLKNPTLTYDKLFFFHAIHEEWGHALLLAAQMKKILKQVFI